MQFKCKNNLRQQVNCKSCIVPAMPAVHKPWSVFTSNVFDGWVGCQELSMWCDVLDDWARVDTLHCKVRGLTNNTDRKQNITSSRSFTALFPDKLMACSRCSISNWAFVQNHFSVKRVSLSFFVQHISLFVTFNDWC